MIVTGGNAKNPIAICTILVVDHNFLSHSEWWDMHLSTSSCLHMQEICYSWNFIILNITHPNSNPSRLSRELGVEGGGLQLQCYSSTARSPFMLPKATSFYLMVTHLSGALLTAGVLTAGLISFRQGNSQLGQKLMRARVVAQGATVALMFGTAYYYGDKL